MIVKSKFQVGSGIANHLPISECSGQKRPDNFGEILEAKAKLFEGEMEIFEGEMLIRTLLTTLHQIFCKMNLHVHLSVKSSIGPDDNFSRKA